jgi:hypothetical protein
MDFHWQDAAVAIAAAVALGWLVRYRIRRRGAKGCDDCPAPDPSASNSGVRLIPASSIRARPPRSGRRA